MKIKNLAIVLSALTFALFFSGCETTVHTDVTRPAELDVTRNTSVTALPFKTQSEMGNYSNRDNPFSTFGSYSSYTKRVEGEELEITKEIDKAINTKLKASNYISYVDTSTVEKAWNNRQQLNLIDVYITGGITQYTSQIEKEEREVYNSEAKKRLPTLQYRRKGSIVLTYQIVDASSNAVLSYENFKKDFYSSWTENPLEITAPSVLIKDTLKSIANSVVKKLEPHEVTVNLTLLNHSDSEMKEANKIAKKGQLAVAESKYAAIYNSEGIFEAGYNAAILLQALERYEEAKALMTRVYNEIGDRQALDALNKINQEIEARKRLQKQLR